MCSLKSLAGSIGGPASRRVTLTPRSARTLVTVPPPAPEPIITTSATGALRITWGMPRLYVGNQSGGWLVYNLQIEHMDEVTDPAPAPDDLNHRELQPGDSQPSDLHQGELHQGDPRQRSTSTVTISWLRDLFV